MKKSHLEKEKGRRKTGDCFNYFIPNIVIMSPDLPTFNSN